MTPVRESLVESVKALSEDEARQTLDFVHALRP
jgi:hypothetical protein